MIYFCHQLCYKPLKKTKKRMRTRGNLQHREERINNELLKGKKVLQILKKKIYNIKKQALQRKLIKWTRVPPSFFALKNKNYKITLYF